MKDRLPDPPDRVGDELDVLLGIVLLRRVDQPDVPLVDQVEEEHVRVAEALRVGDDEAEIRLHELLERLAIVLLHQIAEFLLALGSETRNSGDLLKILVQKK